MSAAINAFSISDILWMRVTGHVLNFRYQGLPDDVHFSIAFNPGSPDVNLHLSRNVEHPAGKPRIEIARIAKSDLNALAPLLHQTLLGMILQPISIRLFARRSSRNGYGAAFLSFDGFGPDSDHPLQQFLLDPSIPITRIRNKTFKLLPKSEQCLEGIAENPKYLETVRKSLRWLPRKLPPGNTSGFLISRKYTGCVVRINTQWYAVRQDIDLLAGLYSLMDPAIVTTLAGDIQAAIKIISKAESALDTEPYNNPIILYQREPGE